jgi:hypothetical protein
MMAAALGAQSAYAGRVSAVSEAVGRASGDAAATAGARTAAHIAESARPALVLEAHSIPRTTSHLITATPVQRPAFATGAVSHDLVSTATRPEQSALPRTKVEMELMHDARVRPGSGPGTTTVPNGNSDSRFHATDGWQKMQKHAKDNGRSVSVHYQYNPMLDKVADVKGVHALPQKLPTTQTRLQPLPKGDALPAKAK